MLVGFSLLYKSKHLGVVITVQHLVTRFDGTSNQTIYGRSCISRRENSTWPANTTSASGLQLLLYRVGVRGSALVTQPTSIAPANQSTSQALAHHRYYSSLTFPNRRSFRISLTVEKRKEEFINHNSSATFSNIDCNAVTSSVFLAGSG